MRCIIGWRRVDDERRNDTMKRMNIRMAYGQARLYCHPWSTMLARSQWRYVLHIIDAYPRLWTRTMNKHILNPSYDPESEYLPRRTGGRP